MSCCGIPVDEQVGLVVVVEVPMLLLNVVADEAVLVFSIFKISLWRVVASRALVNSKQKVLTSIKISWKVRIQSKYTESQVSVNQM